MHPLLKACHGNTNAPIANGREYSWVISEEATNYTLSLDHGKVRYMFVDEEGRVLEVGHADAGEVIGVPAEIDASEVFIRLDLIKGDKKTAQLLKIEPLSGADSQESARALSLGTTYEYTLGDATEGWFSFEPATGQSYVIQTSALMAGVDTVIEVYQRPDDALIGADDDSGFDDLASRLDMEAENDDAWLIRVLNIADGADGSFQIVVQQPSMP